MNGTDWLNNGTYRLIRVTMLEGVCSTENGAKEIKIHGQYVPVRAEVKTIENMSAHADYKEIIERLSQSKMKPRKVFITHGEPSAADELRRRLQENFGWNCIVPTYGDQVRLE